MRKYKEEDILKSLNHSIEAITPNNFDDIKATIKRNEGKMKKFRWQLIPAMTFVLAMIIFGGIYYTNNYVTETLIGIDVNPSIELETNKNDHIIKVNTLNEGANKILDGMNLKGVHLDVALNALIGSMVKYGYLTSDDANILVSVQNNDPTKSEEIKTVVVSTIDKSLNDSKVNATILKQTIENDDAELKNLANSNNISYGKALFINKLIAKDNTLNFNELSTMSMRELAKLVTEKNIDITDIVEKDDDDSTAEKIDEAIEELNEKKENTQDVSNYIAKEEAKKIAFKHANVTANDVKNIAIKLDDDGEYDIEFRTDIKKYEYEINAISGKIVDFETEIIKQKETSTNYITANEAKNIAFKHANIKASDAKLLKVVLDSDDNTKVYDIEFVCNNYEYEYEIDAVTGKIIDFDADFED